MRTYVRCAVKNGTELLRDSSLMLIKNDNTLLAFAFALAIGGAVYSYFRLSTPSMWSGLGALFVFDLVFRLHNRDEGRDLIHPDAGAHLWYVPVWIVAIILGGLGLYLTYN